MGLHQHPPARSFRGSALEICWLPHVGNLVPNIFHLLQSQNLSNLFRSECGYRSKHILGPWSSWTSPFPTKTVNSFSRKKTCWWPQEVFNNNNNQQTQVRLEHLSSGRYALKCLEKMAHNIWTPIELGPSTGERILGSWVLCLGGPAKATINLVQKVLLVFFANHSITPLEPWKTPILNIFLANLTDSFRGSR